MSTQYQQNETRRGLEKPANDDENENDASSGSGEDTKGQFKLYKDRSPSSVSAFLHRQKEKMINFIPELLNNHDHLKKPDEKKKAIDDVKRSGEEAQSDKSEELFKDVGDERSSDVSESDNEELSVGGGNSTDDNHHDIVLLKQKHQRDKESRAKQTQDKIGHKVQEFRDKQREEEAQKLEQLKEQQRCEVHELETQKRKEMAQTRVKQQQQRQEEERQRQAHSEEKTREQQKVQKQQQSEKYHKEQEILQMRMERKERQRERHEREKNEREMRQTEDDQRDVSAQRQQQKDDQHSDEVDRRTDRDPQQDKNNFNDKEKQRADEEAQRDKTRRSGKELLSRRLSGDQTRKNEFGSMNDDEEEESVSSEEEVHRAIVRRDEIDRHRIKQRRSDQIVNDTNDCEGDDDVDEGEQSDISGSDGNVPRGDCDEDDEDIGQDNDDEKDRERVNGRGGAKGQEVDRSGSGRDVNQQGQGAEQRPRDVPKKDVIFDHEKLMGGNKQQKPNKQRGLTSVRNVSSVIKGKANEMIAKTKGALKEGMQGDVPSVIKEKANAAKDKTKQVAREGDSRTRNAPGLVRTAVYTTAGFVLVGLWALNLAFTAAVAFWVYLPLKVVNDVLGVGSKRLE